MRFRIDDSRGARDLVRYFRRRGYLAAEVGDGEVDIVPIESGGDLADRARTLRDLKVWKDENPDVRVDPLEGPAPV